MEKCFLIIEKFSKKDVKDTISLTYEERFIRRKKLKTDSGLEFLVNLPSAISLNKNQAFKLENGQIIVIKYKNENLLEIRGKNLMRLIWHVGNRHIPCEIKEERFLIKNDPIIRDLVEKLGGEVKLVTQTFTPEGGAYGFGRTHSHKH